VAFDGVVEKRVRRALHERRARAVVDQENRSPFS
jgi:hypothetical protein